LLKVKAPADLAKTAGKIRKTIVANSHILMTPFQEKEKMHLQAKLIKIMFRERWSCLL